MSTYLERLASRLVAPPRQIRPRAAARFESVVPASPSFGEWTLERTAAMAAEVPVLPPARAAAIDGAAEGATGRGTPMAAGRGREMVDDRPAPSRWPVVPRISEASHEPEATASETPAAPRSAAAGAWHLESPVTAPAIAATATSIAPEPPTADAAPARAASLPPDTGAPARISTIADPVPTTALPIAPRPAPRPDDRLEPAPRRDAFRPAPAAPSVIPLAAAAALRRHDALASPTAPAPTVVQVTIGTLEVRAPAPPRPRPAAAPPANAAPRLSLQAYLERRR